MALSEYAPGRFVVVDKKTYRVGTVVVSPPLGLKLRISAIVDAHFSLIVDGETASQRTRRGGAQALALNVAQSSTISLKRPPVACVIGLVFGLT